MKKLLLFAFLLTSFGSVEASAPKNDMEDERPAYKTIVIESKDFNSAFFYKLNAIEIEEK